MISLAFLLLLFIAIFFSQVYWPSLICISSFVNDLLVSLDKFSIGGFVLFILVCRSLSFVLHICGVFFLFASEMCFETDITTKHWNGSDLWGTCQSVLPTSDL